MPADSTARLIAIDATPLPPLPAGAGTYILELTRALAALDDDHRYLVYIRSHSRSLFAALPNNVEIVDVGPQPRWRRLVWEQTGLPLDLKRRRASLLLSPHHTTPLLFCPCPAILTIHDVTFFVIPSRYPPARRYYFQSITFAAARRARALIVPSRSVQSEAAHHLRLPAGRFRPIWEGVNESFRPLDRDESARLISHRYGLPRPYLLSLGTREPGKNRAAVFAALQALIEQGRDLHLAVAGQPAWGSAEEEESATRLGLHDRVHFLGYVPQADLPALYAAAAALVFPSLHEGFGLPVLEAMACGTPVITSNTSALPEVAGDAAILVDPRDSAAIARAVAAILDDPALAADLRQKGLQRAARFTWAETARQTLALMRDLLGEPS